MSVKGENSLVRFLSVRSKGQSLLMRGDDMWFFLPAVARPVRITPIQRLLGNVSNGDLARLRYALDYDATVEGRRTSMAAVRRCWSFARKRKGATYQRVRYFVRRVRRTAGAGRVFPDVGQADEDRRVRRAARDGAAGRRSPASTSRTRRTRVEDDDRHL